MKRSRALVLSITLIGCNPEPVGELCDLGSAPAPNEIVVASPSLDCVSGTCLRVPLTKPLPLGAVFPTGNTGLCTAACETDADCEGVAGSPCTGGFTCAVPVTAGPSCCQKMCMCRDYGVPSTDAACDPANSANTCRNLPGRG